MTSFIFQRRLPAHFAGRRAPCVLAWLHGLYELHEF
jgi:hypothetical protein